MLFIDNTITNAYFNIAAEEYLFKNFSVPVFMLWQNEPCIVIGKHQNLHLEANIELINQKKIKIVRRFSGGGTVYHDLGNINLTFISQDNQLDFDQYSRQMQDFLTTIGIKAEMDSRRGLYIDGNKISGSAQYVRGNKSLFHATLLFSSNLNDLTQSLESQNSTEDTDLHPWQSVRSVKSPVTNIENHLKTHLSLNEFKQNIINQFVGMESNYKKYQFSENDITAIDHLIKKKYGTQEWNLKAKMLEQMK
jgi:lipoate-protein ligase A